MGGRESIIPGMHASLPRWFSGPRGLALAALQLTLVAGCGGAQAGAAATVTLPTEPAVEPRGATGQQLEDVFFAYAVQSGQFDVDAALDEGAGGYGDGYEDTAAGEYDDDIAAGEAPGPSAAHYELQDLDAQLARLEDALRAESHPLAEDVTALRETTADIVAHPDDYAGDADINDAIGAVVPALLGGAQLHVSTEAPRPQHTTDCSVATLVLYGAVYELLIEVSMESRMTLNMVDSEHGDWLAEQQLQLSAATALLEWLENPPDLGNGVDDAVDHAWELADQLYDVDGYLTPNTGADVAASVAALGEVESAQDARAGFASLRTAVLATLAQVQPSPFARQIEANERLPGLMRGVLDALPSPGPRAALRALTQRELRELLGTLEWPTDDLDRVAAWTRAACQGAAAP
jgi:hypothetical protein